MKENQQTHAGYAVAVDDQGNFAVTGLLENDTDDIWVGLYQPDGTRQWQKTIDGGQGNSVDIPSAITFDPTGDPVVIGKIAADSNDDTIFIRKLSASDGSEAWTHTVPSEFEDADYEGIGIALGPDGNLVATGTIRVSEKDDDLWMRKLASADGSEVWTQAWSGAPDGNGFSIDKGGPVAVAADGSIYAGARESIDFEKKEATLIKFDEDGNELWTITPEQIEFGHVHTPLSITTGPEGEAYWVFFRNESNIVRFWLQRVSPDGDIEWQLTQEDFAFPPTEDWFVADVAMAPDGMLSVGGRLTNADLDEALFWEEIWFANIDLDGEGQCFVRVNTENEHILPASNYAYGLAESEEGGLMVGEYLDGPMNYLYIARFE
jgi:hypothetical protein